jgi:DNA polymerase-3 subunit gamma/tau
MGQALYRKYRSKSLNEIVGQEHITDTLAKAIKSGRISHAYLFTGPRGVGKTSIARILAHEINGLKYDEQQSHIDIIEIDAASNNGVEDVRDLREKVHIAPAAGKYKIYIIDEVHMLSKAAFNALLKTLEEPPAHVVFILATTEAHKLPETIISRTQRYIFRPIDEAKAVAHLKYIAKEEKITVDDEALKLIAEHGDGSFRDSIGLLDQVGSHGQKVTLTSVQSVLGIAPTQAITALLEAIRSGKAANELYAQLAALLNQGYQPAHIAKQLAVQIRTNILGGQGQAQDSELLQALLGVSVSHDPQAQLEIVLLQAGAPSQPATPAPAPVAQTAVAPKPVLEPVDAPQAPLKLKTTPVTTVEEPKVQHTTESEVPVEGVPKPVKKELSDLDATTWQEVLNITKKQYNTLYGIIRMAEPDFSTSGTLRLAFGFAFHQKRANESKNRTIISDAVTEVTGQNFEVICTYDADATAAKPVLTTGAGSTPAVPKESLSTISNIFGGVEMVE